MGHKEGPTGVAFHARASRLGTLLFSGEHLHDVGVSRATVTWENIYDDNNGTSGNVGDYKTPMDANPRAAKHLSSLSPRGRTKRKGKTSDWNASFFFDGGEHPVAGCNLCVAAAENRNFSTFLLLAGWRTLPAPLAWVNFAGSSERLTNGKNRFATKESEFSPWTLLGSRSSNLTFRWNSFLSK